MKTLGWTFLFIAVAQPAGADWQDQIRDQVTAANVDEPGASLMLAQWQFQRETSYETKSAFLSWLLSNRDALEEYLNIGAVLTLKQDRINGLEGWREIWQAHPESREPGVWRRLAAACAAAFAEPAAEVTPRERYEYFRQMFQEGQLVPYFDQELPFELVLAIHGDRFSNDQFEWAQAVTPKEQKTGQGVGTYGHSLVAYREDNYRGQSVQGPEYYDHKPWHVATFMEYGAVCGRISMMNMMVANAHGAPAFTVGQPGHCAYVWKSAPKTWSGGNFVSGWMETCDSHQQPFWLSHYSANINLVSAAVEAPGFTHSERLRRLAAAWRGKDEGKACEILAAATSADPMHYGAWCDRVEAALAWRDAPASLWPTMAAGIEQAFPKFPIAMTDLLGRFELQRLLAGRPDADRVSYASGVARALTNLPPADQWELIYPAWKPWFARQLTGFGIAETKAAAIVDAKLVVKPRKKGKTKPADSDDVWEQIPSARRQPLELLFAKVLSAVETNATLYKDVAAAWLSLVSQDDLAHARAATFLQSRLAEASDLRTLEKLADAMLNVTRRSADARADLAAKIRKRATSYKKPDPDAMDRLLDLLARYDFRDANRIGAWQGGGPFEWDITPLLARVTGEWALHLNFRWSDGAPLSIREVHLLEGGKEIAADAHEETADESLRPAVYTVGLPQPKPGTKYVVKATAAGDSSSTGVVLVRAEPVVSFDAAEWISIGGWGGKEIQAAPEISGGWHEMEFDLTKHVHAPGILFVLFHYDSYASPNVANVRLLVNGMETAMDGHSCNPISGSRTMYSLKLPAFDSNARLTLRALFTCADGWGTVYCRKQNASNKAAIR